MGGGQRLQRLVNKTLILRWNGTRWVRVASPDPGSSNDLNGVAASSSGNAWTVGTFNGTTREALAIHCGARGRSSITKRIQNLSLSNTVRSECPVADKSAVSH